MFFLQVSKWFPIIVKIPVREDKVNVSEEETLFLRVYFLTLLLIRLLFPWISYLDL